MLQVWVDSSARSNRFYGLLVKPEGHFRGGGLTTGNSPEAGEFEWKQYGSWESISKINDNEYQWHHDGMDWRLTAKGLRTLSFWRNSSGFLAKDVCMLNGIDRDEANPPDESEPLICWSGSVNIEEG